MGCQTSDNLTNTLSLLSVTSHCILLDLAFTSKTRKPLIDQGTQTKSSQEDESAPFIIETTGNSVNYILQLFHIVSTISITIIIINI